MTIGSKSIFVTDGEVFEINEDTVITIPELESNHEEQTQGCYTLSMPANTSKRFLSQALTQMFSSFVYHFNLSSMQIYISSEG